MRLTPTHVCLGLSLGLTLLLTGCGQKGALYLPENPELSEQPKVDESIEQAQHEKADELVR